MQTSSGHDQRGAWVAEDLGDVAQERGALGAVDHTVVEGHRERRDPAGFDTILDHPGALGDLTEREDAGLSWLRIGVPASMPKTPMLVMVKYRRQAPAAVSCRPSPSVSAG